MSMLRPAAFLVLSLSLLMLSAGCGGDDGSSAGPGGSPATDSGAAGQRGAASFNKEGTLAFMRDGDTLAALDLEIAESDAERQRGLMQRLALPAGSGMLFLMDRNEPQGFWMKNTPMALDVFFANADSQIVRVVKNTTPYSTKTFRSGAPAKYVVEVPAGYADRRGIVEGDRIRFRRLDASGPGGDASAFGRSAPAER